MSIVLNGTTGITNDGGYTGDGVVFADTTPANTLVTTTGGNLGVGTASPAVKTEIVGGAETLRLSRSTSGSVYLGLAQGGTRKAYLESNNADLNLFAEAASSNLIFGTVSAERARIDSNGNLLVGTTDPVMASGIGIKLTPAGDGATYPRVGLVTAATTNAQSVNYSLYSTGAAAYRFYVGAGGTISATSATITSLSDQRLKENIRDLDDGLASVMALKPRKFDWKEGKGADIKDARGFIAQEFEIVFPEMIEHWRDPAPEGEEPYKGVNANLIPVLVKAIQELKAIVDAQGAEIAALKGQA